MPFRSGGGHRLQRTVARQGWRAPSGTWMCERRVSGARARPSQLVSVFARDRLQRTVERLRKRRSNRIRQTRDADDFHSRNLAFRDVTRRHDRLLETVLGRFTQTLLAVRHGAYLA